MEKVIKTYRIDPSNEFGGIPDQIAQPRTLEEALATYEGAPSIEVARMAAVKAIVWATIEGQGDSVISSWIQRAYLTMGPNTVL